MPSKQSRRNFEASKLPLLAERVLQHSQPIPDIRCALVIPTIARFSRSAAPFATLPYSSPLKFCVAVDYREAHYLGRTVEITEGIWHCRKLGNAAPRLNPILSDTAPVTHSRKTDLPLWPNGVNLRLEDPDIAHFGDWFALA